MYNNVHLISTKQELRQTLLQGTLLLRVRCVRFFVSASRSEQFSILHDVVPELVEMLDNIWHAFVAGAETGHETADCVAHRAVSEFFQLLQGPTVQIIDFFPCLVKSNSDGVSTLIVLFLGACGMLVTFFPTTSL